MRFILLAVGSIITL